MSDHIFCILQSCFQECHVPVLLACRVNKNDLLMLLRELLRLQSFHFRFWVELNINASRDMSINSK